jgi:acetyl esterase/lipase
MTENQFNVDSPLTFTYKEVDGIRVLLDVYLPPDTISQPQTQSTNHFCPAVVYFHGGGLTVGNRRSWFPTWLKSQFQLCFKFNIALFLSSQAQQDFYY